MKKILLGLIVVFILIPFDSYAEKKTLINPFKIEQNEKRIAEPKAKDRTWKSLRFRHDIFLNGKRVESVCIEGYVFVYVMGMGISGISAVAITQAYEQGTGTPQPMRCNSLE